MALLRRLFYRKPPDRLLEISERVYVFDCCFSTNVMGEDEYKLYLGGIGAQLNNYFSDFSYMVFNFREGEEQSQISQVLTPCNMTVLDYPRHYQSCPLLPLEMIHHFLKTSANWLSVEGQHNVLLMHCERGGWPVLAFMLSGLLLYINQYQGEQKTLEMVQKQAPVELLHLLSSLNPQPSQLRYLEYISGRNLGPDWPPSDTPLLLDFLILRDLPHFEVTKGCRPVLRVYGQDLEARANSSSILLFPTPNTNRHIRLYQQEECDLVKLDIQCRVQGDVVLECIHLHDDLVREEMVFRIMFNTAFVRDNILIVQRDEMDILWDAKNQFPKDFKAEVLFSDAVVTSPEEFYEVGETFSDVIGFSGHRIDSGSSLVVDTASDDSEGKEVWKLGVEPNSFIDCVSDDANHKYDLHGEAPVKDITVDEVQYRSDGKTDTNIDSVKDIGIDDGDEQRKGKIMEGKENDSGIAETQHKGGADGSDSSNDLEPTTQETYTNTNNPISERTQATPRKQVGANAKLAGDLLKPKSKRQETQGPYVRIAKPNAISCLIPPNGGSHKASMHVVYTPKRINSAPAAITPSLKDGKRATSPDGVIPKDAKTKNMRASLSSTDMRSRAPVCSSQDSSPKEERPSLPAASPHQAPPPPKHPPPDLPSLTSEGTSVFLSSQPTASPPPPPPSQNDSFSQTSQIPLLPQPPPPFGSGEPPPPPPPPFRSGGPPPPPLTPVGAPPPSPPPVRGGAPPPPPPPMRGGAPPPPPGPRPPGGGPPPPPGPRPPGGGPPPTPGPRPPGGGPPLKALHWVKVAKALQGSLWYELKRQGVGKIRQEFDVSEIEKLFPATGKTPADKPGGGIKRTEAKPEKVQLIDLKRANNTEIMLTKVKMPLPDMMDAVLKMDDTVLDIDLIENLIKFCPTKEEMELLENYNGDKTSLGKCEKYFLELMKVPRVESKLIVFSFKIQFVTQITEFKKSSNVVKSACEEICTSQKLKEIMNRILYLGNILNRGTARGSAEGFKLDSLLKLRDIRAVNSKITLMHYLCKVIADKASDLLDFHKELGSLESASKIELNSLAEEMKAINKGLEKANQELTASETDGPVSEVFRETLEDFIFVAETEAKTVESLHSGLETNTDLLARYFGEDPKRCPFEQVTATLLTFIRLFKNAHEENIKQEELEKKKAAKEAKMEKAKGVSLTKGISTNVVLYASRGGAVRFK